MALRGGTARWAGIAGIVIALAFPSAVSAQVQPYRTNDGGGFRNVLPSGQNGLITVPQLAGYLVGGSRPPHSDDQLRMYADLVYATPGMTQARLPDFFKDASFGVETGNVEHSYKPRSDVTIVRDKSFGVPHVYGSTRAGAMFGAGYVGAEDRLFFMDVLRHLGRGQVSSFAGGSPGNRAMDHEQWRIAPYTEADLQAQVDRADELYGAEGVQVREDLQNYVDGINAYIREAKLNLLFKMPGEYAAIGKLFGPDPWKLTDVIATAALVGGIFGKGGGGELSSALALTEARARFGRRRGTRVWQDFRSAEDPEAPTTVHRRRFSYGARPKRVARGSVALPDRGSVESIPVVASTSEGAAEQRALREDGRGLGGRTAIDGRIASGDVLAFPSSSSNALLVSARESASGRPLAVMGPQTGYFNPQILMEIDIHGPGVDARGATFPGINLYVLLGRGRDYAWSATSAGQDIIDTFAVDLCEPDGRPPTKRSMHYVFRGRCLPIEVLERTNSWQPNLADSTPAGSETLRAERTKLGIVEGRATIKGKPVIYTKLRSTYMHEGDSSLAFRDINDPARIRSAADFQRAAHKVGYTFNWFYADERDIAYFNSGNNPVRARGVDPNLPTRARFEWRNFNPDLLTASYTPFERHPQVVNQSFITSWNNKQARSYRASDDQWGYGPIYRSELLDDRIRAGIRGSLRTTLPQLVDAMETAGTVDLRGDKVLQFALRVLGRQRDPRLADAIAKLRAWRRDGSRRLDRNRDGVYEHGDAIRIMDAWWPLWLQAQFEPVLGKPLYDRVVGLKPLDNPPNNHGDHLGSAYQGGIQGTAEKDLRSLLGRRRLRGMRGRPWPVRGRYSRRYCGRGSLSRCRALLADSLRRALDVDPKKLYEDEICGSQPSLGPGDPGRKPSDQWCYDAIWMRALGAAEQPVIHWINRPTFQQAVEVQGDSPR